MKDKNTERQTALEKIRVENLTYSYPNKNTNALNNISLSIKKGDFVLITGGSGSGKSSLLRALSRLIPDFHGGYIQGNVFIDNKNIINMNSSEIAKKIGFIFQNPENQIIFSDTEKEIAFGMENLNFSLKKMKQNISDVSCYLGITKLIDRKTKELSGGEKQKVAVASVLCMQPDVLLLDEPTSQLDPISAENIINTLRRLNEDFGITIIIIEHRFDICFHIADKLLYMNKGYVKFYDTPQKFIMSNLDNIVKFIPIISKQFIWRGLKTIPMTVKDAGKVLDEYPDYEKSIMNNHNNRKNKHKNKNNTAVIELSGVCFSYSNKDDAKNQSQSEYTLKNISLRINKGSFTSIHGEVGAGKSTLMKLITLKHRQTEGWIKIFGKKTNDIKINDIAGKIAYLSQNPADYLSQDTVREEMTLSKELADTKPDTIAYEFINNDIFDINKHLNTHPRDLSTGEQQRLAIASVLMLDPEIILLDEPTRGLDNINKNLLGDLLLKLQKKGITIILITHDIEFAYTYSEKSLIISRGELIIYDDTETVLNQSLSYTTELGKLLRRR